MLMALRAGRQRLASPSRVVGYGSARSRASMGSIRASRSPARDGVPCVQSRAIQRRSFLVSGYSRRHLDFNRARQNLPVVALEYGADRTHEGGNGVCGEPVAHESTACTASATIAKPTLISTAPRAIQSRSCLSEGTSRLLRWVIQRVRLSVNRLTPDVKCSYVRWRKKVKPFPMTRCTRAFSLASAGRLIQGKHASRALVTCAALFRLLTSVA